MTHLVGEEVFTVAEVATAIKGIKSGKAADEDEIILEMLKALTAKEIFWLTRGVKLSGNLAKLPEIGKQV